jgi:DNA polymerase-4
MSDRLRAIVHLDLDAFFASVEVLQKPELVDKPVVVGGRPEERGVVASASYAARAFGIGSAMPTSRAVALCPEIIVLPPHHRLYREYSSRVMDILHETSPMMQQVSIDEAYLDLTDCVNDWEDTIVRARELQQQVRQEVGLSASLGVASNKLVAKVASDRNKPGGLTVVRPGEEEGFLAPLPVRVLWGIGPVTAQRLGEMGISTVGDLARVPPEELRARFGSHGTAMAQHCRGIDSRPVITEWERKSVSQERTFTRDVANTEVLSRQLWELSQGVAQHLKRSNLAAGTVAIKLRYADFTTLTRQLRLDVPTDDEQEIYRAARVLLNKAWQQGRAVRLLGVAGRHLSTPPGQMSLW